jgi:hypothetical protein
LLGITIDRDHHGDSIYITESKTLAAQAMYVLFVILISPSIRTWDKLNGQILAGKCTYGKVKPNNSVRGNRIN